MYTALAVPPVALVCAQIFRGSYARTIAHHDAYAVAIGVVALAGFFVVVRAWQRLYRGSVAPSVAWLAAALCALSAVAAYYVDQRLLVRLYPFFHAGLGVLSFGAAELALAMAALATRRRIARLLEPRNAALVGLVAVAAGAASLAAIGRQARAAHRRPRAHRWSRRRWCARSARRRPAARATTAHRLDGRDAARGPAPRRRSTSFSSPSTPCAPIA